MLGLPSSLFDMPHLAAVAIDNWISTLAPSTDFKTVPLPSSYAAIISTAITEDAAGLLYSSQVTFADAIKGLLSGNCSWSVVKLYYSAFYAARSILASNYISICYPDGRPHSLYCAPNEKIRKETGLTHKLVWKILSRQFSNLNLLNTIDGIPAHDWITNLREQANYRNAKFPDPALPIFFAEIDKNGVNRSIDAYVADDSFLYTFDPDHAAIAFPLACIANAKRSLETLGKCLDDSDQQHVDICCEAAGIGSEVIRAL